MRHIVQGMESLFNRAMICDGWCVLYGKVVWWLCGGERCPHMEAHPQTRTRQCTECTVCVWERVCMCACVMVNTVGWEREQGREEVVVAVFGKAGVVVYI